MSGMMLIIVGVIIALLLFVILGPRLAFINGIFNKAQDCEELHKGHCYEKGVECEGGTVLPLPDLCKKDDVCITGEYDPGRDCEDTKGDLALPRRGKTESVGTTKETENNIEVTLISGNYKQMTTVCQKGKSCTKEPIILSENIGTVGVSDTAICYDPREEQIALTIKAAQTEYLYHYILKKRNERESTIVGSSNKEKLVKLEKGKDTEVLIETKITMEDLEEMAMSDNPVYLFLQTYEKDKIDAEKILHKGVYEVYLSTIGLCKDVALERESVGDCKDYNGDQIHCELAKLANKEEGGDCTYKDEKCLPEFVAYMQYCGVLGGYKEYCEDAYDANGEKCIYEETTTNCMPTSTYTDLQMQTPA